MKRNQAAYGRFALTREMLQTPDIVRRMDARAIASYAAGTARDAKVLLTGEGSSRIFPAKKLLADAWRNSYSERLWTQSATLAQEFGLSGATVFVSSNSGKTAECVRLMRFLHSAGGSRTVGVVANEGTPIALEAGESYVLSCGPEDAVAATKSVVEQALFYDILFRSRNGAELPDLGRLADLMEEALTADVPPPMADALAGAETVYWAGRDDGTAEELTLKTNEIARKRADFLEGTYAVHGIEEVMSPRDALVVVEPFAQEEEKFDRALRAGVGMPVFAIGSGPSRFPRLATPSYGQFSPYIQLCAGWNLLAEVGLSLGIDLDRPVRARKIGNEFGAQ